MGKATKSIRFVMTNFGPLITFYGVNHFYGLQKAIVFSTVFTVVEIGIKIRRKEPIPTLFKFTAAMTLIFGGIDLYFQQSILFKYEAAVTNSFTGVFFGTSLLGKTSILQNLQAGQDDGRVWTPDRVAYMRILTGIWTGYFFMKAGAYFWMASHFDIERGLMIRTIAGTASFYAMLVVSVFGSRLLFPWMKQNGLLPAAEVA